MKEQCEVGLRGVRGAVEAGGVRLTGWDEYFLRNVTTWGAVPICCASTTALTQRVMAIERDSRKASVLLTSGKEQRRVRVCIIVTLCSCERGGHGNVVGQQHLSEGL